MNHSVPSGRRPAAGAGPRLEVARRLDGDDVARVLALVDAATRSDGVVPLSEHVLLHLRRGGEEPGRHVLLVDDTLVDHPVVGYGHLDPTDAVSGPSAELVVAPERRRGGLGALLVRALEAESPAPPRLWAHGLRPDARSLAASMGYVVARELLQLRRSLHAELPPVRLPAGVSVRTFTDDDAYELLEVNAAAFADHPEQGSWTSGDLAVRMSEPWFDPSGLFLAEPDDDATDTTAATDITGAAAPPVLAFHWTKVHGDDPAADHGHHPIGEVYVVGVHPRAQGLGLGRAMTLVGLHHLRNLGLEQVMLYVDADNGRAVRTYTGLGFTHWDSDVQFRLAGG